MHAAERLRERPRYRSGHSKKGTMVMTLNKYALMAGAALMLAPVAPAFADDYEQTEAVRALNEMSLQMAIAQNNAAIPVVQTAVIVPTTTVATAPVITTTTTRTVQTAAVIPTTRTVMVPTTRTVMVPQTQTVMVPQTVQTTAIVPTTTVVATPVATPVVEETIVEPKYVAEPSGYSNVGYSSDDDDLDLNPFND